MSLRKRGAGLKVSRPASQQIYVAERNFASLPQSLSSRASPAVAHLDLRPDQHGCDLLSLIARWPSGLPAVKLAVAPREASGVRIA